MPVHKLKVNEKNYGSNENSNTNKRNHEKHVE